MDIIFGALIGVVGTALFLRLTCNCKPGSAIEKARVIIMGGGAPGGGGVPK